MTEPPLPIHDLSARHPGLTLAIASYYTEAARVCLDRHHASPVGIEIDNAGAVVASSVEWEATDRLTKAAHANEIDATEVGAYACVLAAVELALQMVAVHRAETATGADYYIAPAGSTAADLETAFRLRATFLKLTRNLAPTGKTFGELEVRGSDEARPITLLPTTRRAIGEAVRKATRQPHYEASPTEEPLRGVLRAVHLDEDWLEVTVEGLPVKIVEIGEAVDDVIGPMINGPVLVRVIRDSRGRQVFRDIEPQE